MARQWQSLDPEATEEAFLAIPVRELVPLLNGMRAHNDGYKGGHVLKKQGGGIWAIKASAQSRAVCLFFSSPKKSVLEILTIVAAFRTDSGEIPPAEVEAASSPD